MSLNPRTSLHRRTPASAHEPQAQGPAGGAPAHDAHSSAALIVTSSRSRWQKRAALAVVTTCMLWWYSTHRRPSVPDDLQQRRNFSGRRRTPRNASSGSAPRAVIGSAERSNFCENAEVEIQIGHASVNLDAGDGAAVTALRDNVTVTGLVEVDAYKYFQVCVAAHPEHHHKVHFELTYPPTHNADLYISVDIPHPTFDHSTWLSADRAGDSITIPTYVEDFLVRIDLAV